jgi:Phosphotransferase enzyme family
VTVTAPTRSSSVSPSPITRRPLRRFVEESGLQSVVIGVSKDPNAKLTVLLVAPGSGKPMLVAKVPTSDAAAVAVEAEMAILRGLRGLKPWHSSPTLPRVVDVVELDGRPSMVTTALGGVPMTASYLRWRHTASRRRVAADFAAASGWLAQFQSETAGALAPLDLDGGVARRLRERFAGDDRLDSDLRRLAEIHGRLSFHRVRRCAVHGDFWPGNILLTGERVSGVVDWEAGALSGEPVRDLVRFALMYALYLDRRTHSARHVSGHPGLRASAWGAGVEYALNHDAWFPRMFRRFLSHGLSRLGAAPECWRDAALAGVAEVAALTDDPEFGRRHLELFRRLPDLRPHERGSG